jgi:SAM-dependent methyltransferase
MALETLDLIPSTREPVPHLQRFLDDADQALDTLIADGLHHRLPNFAPADFDVVHATLATLAEGPLAGERFLEWGSAMGGITGIAAALGFRASGIEIDTEMADRSRALLDAHGLRAEIVEGSFVPDDHDVPPEFEDPETATLQTGHAAYDLLERDIEDFSIVYAYPWPDMDDAFRDLFDTYASPGALFVTYHGRDGCRVSRKT